MVGIRLGNHASHNVSRGTPRSGYGIACSRARLRAHCGVPERRRRGGRGAASSLLFTGRTSAPTPPPSTSAGGVVDAAASFRSRGASAVVAVDVGGLLPLPRCPRRDAVCRHTARQRDHRATEEAGVGRETGDGPGRFEGSGRRIPLRLSIEAKCAMTILRPTTRPPLLAPSADRRERRRLALEDQRGADLATLAAVRDVLVAADGIVATGWVQEALFVVRDASGGERALASAASVRVETVTRACLVGAIVLAAGGPEAATTRPVRRGVEAVWHALYRREEELVDWCPATVVHGGHVRDLARWNDSPRTSQADVRALLGRGQDVVARDRERVLQA